MFKFLEKGTEKFSKWSSGAKKAWESDDFVKTIEQIATSPHYLAGIPLQKKNKKTPYINCLPTMRHHQSDISNIMMIYALCDSTWLRP